MNDTAHRPIDIARRCAVVLCLGALRGQDILPPPRYAEIDALAVRALDAKDPIARGEAALWLADSGSPQHYDAILRVAKDPAAPARHRGILAVGRLGVAGAEAFLGRLVLASNAEDPDAAIAAFALGQLDDSVPAPSIDALLRRAQGGSRRRNEALLTALVAGLATKPHPSRGTTVRALVEDESNRSAALTVSGLAMLDKLHTPVAQERVAAWLVSEHADVRRAAIAACAGERKHFARAAARLQRLARVDADPGVRAAALRALAQHLDASATDLADRALRSRFPVEAAAAAEVLLTLAGGARRRDVEERVLAPDLSPELRGALLEVLPPPLAPRVLLLCHDNAQDASAPLMLRTAAALALARADSVLASAALHAVFAAADEVTAATRLAFALHGRDGLHRIAAQILATDATVAWTCSPVQLHAIARADAVLGTDLFLALSTAGRLRDTAFTHAFAALRKARVRQTSAALHAVLPAAVAALEP
jgi:hypothetical protein